MSLHDRLSDDLKSAMKSRDQLRMDVIRMIKAAVQYKEVELKQDLDDAAMSRIMTTLIKQRKEAAEQFEKGNRQDLATKERQEIIIIEGYLPAAFSSDEVAQIVETVVKESGASSVKDMGSEMKAVMARLTGQTVDGKLISDLVKASLQR
ncbi:MAG: GatB/YqeY domain-containing protein [Nitrospirota bacterium]|nr:GatB/YqeY domain-containing protein [Nitrospirota bacterium]